jgi:PadR family transcriptional regulator, regulatory protein AphA
LKQTEYVVLGLLSEAPSTGYQIKKIIDIRFRFFWNESYGQLYPTLKSLTASGLIEEARAAGRRNRSQKTYQIKPAGLAALQNWLEQPVERESIRLEILLKMYFSHLVDVEVMLRHLRVFQQEHEQDLEILKMFETELKTIIDKDPDHPYVLRVVDFGLKVNEAYLKWSRETAAFLESRRNK